MKRIVFLGAKRIGAECLSALISLAEQNDAKICGVCTNPRGEEVVAIARDNGIPIYDNLLSVAEKTGSIDFIFSVQYHKILTQAEIDLASVLAVNLHMAPLPEYRGSNQFSRALLDGAEEFGATLHSMSVKIDGGDILFEDRFPITSKWVWELYKETERRSLDLFVSSVPALLRMEVEPRAQDSFVGRSSSFMNRKDIDSLKSVDARDLGERVSKIVRATSMPGFEPPFSVIDGNKVWFVVENLAPDFCNWYRNSRGGKT